MRMLPLLALVAAFVAGATVTPMVGGTPYNDDHDTLVIEHWPARGRPFPFGHRSLIEHILLVGYRSPLAELADPRLLEVALGAERAEVTRVEPPHLEGGRCDHSGTIVELGAARALTSAELRRLQVILGAPRFRGPTHQALPRPAARVRFHRGAASADLLICAECGQLQLTEAGRPVAEDSWPELGLQKPAMMGWLRAVYPDEPSFRRPLDGFWARLSASR